MLVVNLADGVLFSLAVVCVALIAGTSNVVGQAVDAPVFFTQEGTDPVWQELLDAKAIPTGRNSTDGITGSRITVNRSIVEQGMSATNPVPDAIRIHTLGNSMIPRRDFAKWSRWYQEDGNTQVFRLFKGEHNVRNERANSARIEAFSAHKWNHGDGWQQWEGRYTLVAPEGAIFQVKAPGPVDWAVMISAAGDDRLTLQPRRGERKTVDSGRQFDLRVRDNGLAYEVFVNGNLALSGHYDRQGLASTFRWGMYVGGKRLVSKDAMILVTGATITPASHP
jgi:hypothetical protein